MRAFCRILAAALGLLWPLAAMAQSSAPMSGQVVAEASGPVTLDGTKRVPLLPSAGASSLRQRLAALGAPGQVFLVLGDLQAKAQPGVIYNVYLDLPPDTPPQPEDPHFVGTLNFFGVAPPNTASQHRSYDVTQKVNTLLSRPGAASSPVTVTIAPSGGAPAAQQPVIGRIALLAQ